jgi:hypothetical protein
MSFLCATLVFLCVSVVNLLGRAHKGRTEISKPGYYLLPRELSGYAPRLLANRLRQSTLTKTKYVFISGYFIPEAQWADIKNFFSYW